MDSRCESTLGMCEETSVLVTVLLVETNAAEVIFHLVNNYFECKKYIDVDADRSLVGVPKEMILLKEKLVD